MNIKHMKAYGHGALDGYNLGVDNNPYDPSKQGEEHQAYKMGYDYGVAVHSQDLEETT